MIAWAIRGLGRGWIRMGGVLAAGLLTLAATAETDRRVMQAYPLFTPEVVAMISVAESVLGPGSRVIHDRTNGRLLVLATDDDHARLRETLEAINQPPVNIRIEVAIEEDEREQLTAVGVSGDAEVRVEDDRVEARGRVAPRIQARDDRRRRTMRQTLLLQSGGEAVLHIGEEAPQVEWLVRYGDVHGDAVRVASPRETGALLRVQARVIGDGPLISLKLTPEVTARGEGGPERYRFTRLSTDITVSDGQAIRLGGLEENSEFYRRFLIGIDRQGAQRALTIVLTPRIEAP